MIFDCRLLRGKGGLFFPWGKEAPSFFPQGKKEVEGKRYILVPFFLRGTKKNSTFFFVPGGHLLFPLGLSAFFPKEKRIDFYILMDVSFLCLMYY